MFKTMTYNLNTFTVMHCPPLPKKSHVLWSTEETTWNTTVYATCQYGYRRLPVEQYSSFVCLDNGRWNNDPSAINCSRTSYVGQ